MNYQLHPRGRTGWELGWWDGKAVLGFPEHSMRLSPRELRAAIRSFRSDLFRDIYHIETRNKAPSSVIYETKFRDTSNYRVENPVGTVYLTGIKPGQVVFALKAVTYILKQIIQHLEKGSNQMPRHNYATAMPGEFDIPDLEDEGLDLGPSKHLPVHVTAGGSKVLISAMSDKHLTNTIRMFLRPLAAATEQVGGVTEQMSPRARALYGDRQQTLTENYSKIVGQTQSNIGPYVVEAMLRGLIEVQEMLQIAFGRDARDGEAPVPMQYAHAELGEGNSTARRVFAKVRDRTEAVPDPTTD